MNTDLGMLSLAAVTIGLVHTMLGPDHYIPFVAMSRVGRWPMRKTVLVTLLCGLGHVGSSVVLGMIGIGFGVVVAQLEAVESVRAEVAGWLLVAFGLSYTVWGCVRAMRNLPHAHLHAHEDGTWHAHQHVHQGEHLHVHAAQSVPSGSEPATETAGTGHSGRGTNGTMTPWILFVVFLFGPCEPLIPLLMYPAAKSNVWAVVWVSTLFALATLITMTGIVVLLSFGTQTYALQRLHRFSHALAGLAVLACGVAIKLGL